MAVIGLAYVQPDTCRMTVDGQTFEHFLDGRANSAENHLQATLERQAVGHSTARIDGDETIPYKCFGWAVFSAQRAGFKRVGFIAEPPKSTNP
jgi:hypothetical protein